MFGCAWKINFPENIFSWLCFSSFDLEIVFSQNFHFKPFPNSCRERERERAQIMPSTSLIYEPTNRSSTQSLWPTSLRLRRRPRAFVPWTHKLIFLCVILIFCVILIDQRIDLHFCVILIFYFLSLISDFFVVVVMVWVVVFWWFSCCVVVGFVWVVVENSIFRMLPNTWKYFLEQFS